MAEQNINHMIVGLGGTGGRIVCAFRKTVFQEHRNLEPRKYDPAKNDWSHPAAHIEYIYVDSNNVDLENKSNWKVLGQSVGLAPDGKLLISEADVQTVLANSTSSPGISPWIGDETVLKPMLANAAGAKGANQIRRFGRFLFATKVRDFNGQIQKLVSRLEDRDRGSGRAGVAFHICCTLAAGTGSGSIVDAVSQIRKNYKESSRYPIYLYVLVTDKHTQANTGNFYSNQYAALSELNALKLGKFRPHDIGAVSPTTLETKDPYQQCYLMTAENEQGDTATLDEQEQMVADFIYQKVVALKGALPDKLHKADSFEDISKYPHENGERSYFFGAFGVKRLLVPEQEIGEKLAYTFAHQSVLQMLFNNWMRDSGGFSKDPANRDLPEIVVRPANNEGWYLTDAQLRLSKDFRLQGGVDWPHLDEGWGIELDGDMSDIMETYAEKKEQWLPQMRDLADKYFKGGFREQGVVSYYEKKREVKLEYAREIRGKIENDLFGKWRGGEESMHDIGRTIEAILSNLDDRKKGVDQQIAYKKKEEDDASELISRCEDEWAKIGFLTDLFGKSQKVFASYTSALKRYYIARTEIVAMEFSKDLIAQVITELTGMNTQITQCKKVLDAAAKSFSDAIACRCNSNETANFKSKLVRLMEPDKIHGTIHRLSTDLQIQKKQIQEARDKICKELGSTQPTFTIFAQKMKENTFFDILSEVCDSSALREHDTLFLNQGIDVHRILGMNIIEKLNEQYGGISESLQDNMQTLIRSAASYMSFDGQQTQPSVQLKDPNAPNMPLGCIVVLLPKCDHLKDFRDELKRIFEKAISGSQSVQVVDSDHNPNEITILSIRYWFPLRFIKPLVKVKESYDQAIRSKEKEAVHQIHLQNHRSPVEGVRLQSGYGTLPDLFLMDTETARKHAAPVALLASAMGLVRCQKNPDTGLESLYFAERNESGRALTTPIDLGVTHWHEMIAKVSPEHAEMMDESVKKHIEEGQYKNQDKKIELLKLLDSILDQVYEQRGKNDLDKIYIRCMEAVEEAKLRIK